MGSNRISRGGLGQEWQRQMAIWFLETKKPQGRWWCWREGYNTKEAWESVSGSLLSTGFWCETRGLNTNRNKPGHGSQRNWQWKIRETEVQGNETTIHSQKLRYKIQNWLEGRIKAGTRLMQEASQRLPVAKLMMFIHYLSCWTGVFQNCLQVRSLAPKTGLNLEYISSKDWSAEKASSIKDSCFIPAGNYPQTEIAQLELGFKADHRGQRSRTAMIPADSIHSKSIIFVSSSTSNTYYHSLH